MRTLGPSPPSPHPAVAVAPDTVERFDAPSVTLYVLGRLRADILAARYRPGAKLPLKALTDRYRVSVVPIREALAILSGNGLVVAESQRGFRVAPASQGEFEDITRIRRQLECTALAMAVRTGDDTWRRRVRAAYDDYECVSQKAGQDGPISDGWEDRHRRFHFTLIDACGSPTLLAFCEQLHDRFDRYRRLTLPSGSFMAGVAGDHLDLVDAALAGDAPRAVALLDRHIADIAAIVRHEYATAGAERT